jgi:primary-amine oxidase
LLREAGHLGEACRFGSVVLREPPKSVVLAFDADGTAAAREAAAIVLDKADGKAYEAIVSLSDGSVTRWEHVPGVQPQVLLEEFFECEEVVKADAGVQEALRKRGIHEFDGVMVDPWSAGHYGDEEHGRLLRALVWVKMGGPDDNGYAHPVENLVVYVDTNASRVVRIEDHGVIPVPQQPGNYTPDAVVPRTDLTPIEIAQPEGTSFTVDGHEVRWQKWRFRVGFTPREGLVLHTVGYTDGDRERSVLYRASLSEMVVPYGDPAPTHRRKNLAHHLWVTPHDERERHGAGDYPNQHQGGEGLPRWTAADRQVADTDVVVWYTFGEHHAARLEDWPVMPVQYAGFSLQPTGFFDRNPALDVPRPTNGHRR